ncbi:MAG: hypothetical protein MJY92_07320, partial [Bacteroidales bacterium]|nr:hypothetical protein [Bacteroidales bacterium]
MDKNYKISQYNVNVLTEHLGGALHKQTLRAHGVGREGVYSKHVDACGLSSRALARRERRPDGDFSRREHVDSEHSER